jgi:hypothetical protein
MKNLSSLVDLCKKVLLPSKKSMNYLVSSKNNTWKTKLVALTSKISKAKEVVVDIEAVVKTCSLEAETETRNMMVDVETVVEVEITIGRRAGMIDLVNVVEAVASTEIENREIIDAITLGTMAVINEDFIYHIFHSSLIKISN